MIAAHSTLVDTLDRGVVLAAVVGVVANGLQSAIWGGFLTLFVACCYGVVRNRLANEADFETLPSLHHPVIDLRCYRLCCLWLGSVHLYQGLLGDMMEADASLSRPEARRQLNRILWKTLCQRCRTKLLALFWLDRLL